MNDREKKLIFILFGAAFFIANVFVYTSYEEALKKKQIELKNGAAELKLKNDQLIEADRRGEEIQWLANHMPVEGTHISVRGNLVTFVAQSAQKFNITPKKQPSALRENPDEVGDFRSAVVKVMVNCRDPELYRWLCELQNPEQARSITRLKISPQRDNAERIDCELEITQWFTPVIEEVDPLEEPLDEATATN